MCTFGQFLHTFLSPFTVTRSMVRIQRRGSISSMQRRASQKVPAPKESLNEFEQRREVPVEQAIDLCVKRRAFPRRVMW
jgi:hypothetical protein